jgi:ornithine cyclodeaminase/alanine dehydrogenase-like protein (mu-crystallin family)
LQAAHGRFLRYAATMKLVTPEEIDRALDFPALIDALSEAFRADIKIPPRAHIAIPRPDAEATLLLMPAWTEGTAEPYVGIKSIAIFPANLARGIPSLTGSYMLLSGKTGVPLAIMDGGLLTRWRTAAASALAARFLAREDASRHLIVGAGALAPFFARAFASVRPIREISIWNRTGKRAEDTSALLRAEGLPARAVPDLEAAVRKADIVTCLTGAEAPILHGAWLKPGAHVDLVGGFKPAMRESDDETLVRARIYLDTRHAMAEAGDLLGPLQRGVIAESDIQGDLFELCRGEVAGRGGADEITLFKSAGTAVEDLAAAILVWRRVGAG